MLPLMAEETYSVMNAMVEQLQKRKRPKKKLSACRAGTFQVTNVRT